MAKKSETLSQRQKAQNDIIALKKMRDGEIDPGPKPSEIVMPPMTVGQKIVNFFYHYKIAVILCSFFVIVGSILMIDLIRRPKYDSKIVTFSYDSVYSAYSQQIANYFESLYSDVNGNGKVEVANIDCCCSANDHQTKTAAFSRLHSTISAEADALIFIMDEESIKHFDGLDTELFDKSDIVMLPKSFYSAMGEDTVFGTKLFAVMRKVDDTLIEGKNSEAIKAAKQVMLALKTEWSAEAAENAKTARKTAEEAVKTAEELSAAADKVEAELAALRQDPNANEEVVAEAETAANEARREAETALLSAENLLELAEEAEKTAEAARIALEKAEAEK